MRCPKCQYIGFGSASRCRNCGYDFSLADDTPALEDLPIQTGEEPIGPYRDLPLGVAADGEPPAALPAQPSARPAPPSRGGDAGDGHTPADLPLFSISALDDRPLVSAPAVPRPPLAVRRDPPVITRLRQPAFDDEPGGAGTPDRRDSMGARTPGFADEDVDRATGGEAAGDSAPIPARLLAGALDVAIMAGIDIGVLALTLRFTGVTLGELAQISPIPMAAFLLLLNGGYLVMFTAAGGQTIGKMASGVRVVPDDGGARVRFVTSMLRAAAYLVSLLPAGLGFLPILFSPDGRAIHDRLSSTRVVKA